MYNIDTFFLDDIKHFFKKDILSNWSRIDFVRDKPMLFMELLDLGIEIIEEIHQNIKNVFEMLSAKNQGSILIFLPGLNEIYSFIDKMNEKFGDNMK